MIDSLPIGPYRFVPLSSGRSVPFYVIPFDKKGICEAPKTKKELLSKVSEYSDIFVFSHGWNNDWQAAIRLYEGFIEGYANLQEKSEPNSSFKPLLIGIFWPSAWLVAPWEGALKIASVGAKTLSDDAIAAERKLIQEMAAEIPQGQIERFYELLQLEELSKEEQKEFASIVAPLMHSNGDIDLGSETPNEKDLLVMWNAIENSRKETLGEEEDFGTVSDRDTELEEAGRLGTEINKITPRKIIRLFSVWQMKDRAGLVGSAGVSRLLSDLRSNNAKGKLHLIGHSYGAKVMLSALCRSSIEVDSVLLLQPAVSHLCFADEGVIEGIPRGGYRKALDLVKNRIVTTYSRNDIPLRSLFHLGLMRAEDLAEQDGLKTAGLTETPPSKFAALGGYGPRGIAKDLIEDFEMENPPDPYEFKERTKLVALNGDSTIQDHCDVSNTSTWWLLHNLVRN